jgi:alpha-galactosidase
MNPEVLAVDQDPLGHAAVQVHQDGDLQIWARPLEDGGYAVGLFNLGPTEAKIHTDWSRDLKVEGFMKVRELWRRRDAGRSKGYTGKVASHGALLLKVSK